MLNWGLVFKFLPLGRWLLRTIFVTLSRTHASKKLLFGSRLNLRPRIHESTQRILGILRVDLMVVEPLHGTGSLASWRVDHLKGSLHLDILIHEVPLIEVFVAQDLLVKLVEPLHILLEHIMVKEALHE